MPTGPDASPESTLAFLTLPPAMATLLNSSAVLGGVRLPAVRRARAAAKPAAAMKVRASAKAPVAAALKSAESVQVSAALRCVRDGSRCAARGARCTFCAFSSSCLLLSNYRLFPASPSWLWRRPR